MMAMTILLFMVYIAKEVSRDSLIEFAVNSQELNRLKAYYAARNGMQLALLRVKIFQQTSRLALPPGMAGELDQIWKFPFAWPIPVPKEVNSVAKDSVAKLTAESFMDATYTHTIDDEGSKIDVNDLISPSKTLQDVTKKQLLTIFERKLEFDEEFRKEYQSFRFEDLVNRMIDWMSDKNTSAGGGSKKQYFSALGEQYPPNRGFRTLDEMRLVPGMTEEFFKILESQVTIYGMKAINPNTAPEEVLKSLDKGMTDEAVKEALARRNDPDLGGQFKGTDAAACSKDFKDFVLSRGARLDPSFDQIPMVCDKVVNFKIKSTGIFGNGSHAVVKEITTVVIDLSRAANLVKSMVDKEKAAGQAQQGTGAGGTGAAGAGGTTGQTSGAPKQDPLPKGPPRVVYWSEN
ncbi:MAG: general secretion pathway protein GspK [Bdellovibrio sp.]|nr:general secretion pathway protein GspK [Bdellovibrio sp.]